MGCAHSEQVKEHHCCPPGSWPAISITHAPQGINEVVDGLTVYHVGAGNRVLILFEDIFGIETGRHKAIADTYSQMGFNVFLPELLDAPYSGSI